ncbi:MAG TPA: hypothetical protein PK020_17070 [Ilumatobacteraceae bacterium]|nr:hypothetical protein [Ilumatobacteraceae bacterium]
MKSDQRAHWHITPANDDELHTCAEDLARHDRTERRLAWKEAGAVAVVTIVVVVRQLWLS